MLQLNCRDQVVVAERLHRPCLGRMTFIGELYDARSESLASQSLLKNSFPSACISTTSMDRMEIDYKATDTVSDRFDLFKIEGELQVAVLSNLIKVGGSALYLTEELKTEKITSYSLICKIQTVNEKLVACFEEILPHIDMTALNDPRFTHVVAEIEWGGNFLVSLEATCDTESSKKHFQGTLAATTSFLGKLCSVKPSGEAENNRKSLEDDKNVRVRMSADVVPQDGLPTSIEAVQRFMEGIPELLRGVNGGKGKPLTCFMIPLSGLRKMAKLPHAVETVIQKIDDSLLSSIVFFFEDVMRMKQKVHDLLTLMNENEKFVPSTTLKETRKKQQELIAKESELKCLIRQEWVPVRSGEKTLKDLTRTFDQFKSRNFRLTDYEDFLDSQCEIVSKLSTVRDYTSKGAFYLGTGERLEDVQRSNVSHEFIVFVTSSEMQKSDPELHMKNSQYFASLLGERLPDTVYMIADLDLEQQNFGKVDRVTCLHLKGTTVISKDLLSEYLEDCETNFARLGPQEKLELCKHKPGNRVVLEIPCPGFEKGCCPPNEVQWQCTSCRTALQYGFDDHIYCLCGKASAHSYVYRCKTPRHGDAFISPSPEFLRKVLSKLRPLKELNLLVLGQSGVGKSTWINSIINYLTYDSLEEAKSSGAIVVIPAKFTMFDSKTMEKRVFQVGEENDNEVTLTGHSATQFSRTYTFLWNGRCVRIIDTPGLGDTEGIEKDKENIKNVISHISKLKDLHGVCILLKANENRMNVLFSYCVKELLVHLHKSVAKNVIFCFTNSRNSFYSPGAASTLIENLIDGLEIKSELTLGKYNMFCLDNEAFLFLCALENGMTFDDDLAESFEKSWQISLKETRRLFETVANYEPHSLKETVSLVTARMRVLSLTKPLAEVSKTIQMNIDLCTRKQAELSDKNLTLEDLSKKLNLTVVELEPHPLKKPRTVCTSSKCVAYVSLKNADYNDIEYKTHCHVQCYLNDVTPKTTNNVALKSCAAMNPWGNCKVCGCSWSVHMHITYSQERVEKTIVDENVAKDLMKEKSEKENLENFMKNLQEQIDDYNKEREFIIHATAQFGLFLKKNAISVYNDYLEEYLLHLIKQEEEKPHKSEKEYKVLENLKATLDQYREEVQVLTKAINSGSKSEEMTPEGVSKLEKELYALKLTGKMIKQLVDLSVSSTRLAATYSEQPVELYKVRGCRKGQVVKKKSLKSKILNLLY